MLTDDQKQRLQNLLGFFQKNGRVTTPVLFNQKQTNIFIVLKVRSVLL